MDHSARRAQLARVATHAGEPMVLRRTRPTPIDIPCSIVTDRPFAVQHRTPLTQGASRAIRITTAAEAWTSLGEAEPREGEHFVDEAGRIHRIVAVVSKPGDPLYIADVSAIGTTLPPAT